MKKSVKILLLMLIAGLLAISYIWFFVYNKAHENYADAKPVARLQADKAYTLFSEHDPSVASYPGQVIQIEGTAQKLETGDTLTIIVFVFNEGPFGDEGIRCSLLPASAEKALKLSFPAKVSIKGFCSGYNETDLIMEQCTLIND